MKYYFTMAPFSFTHFLLIWFKSAFSKSASFVKNKKCDYSIRLILIMLLFLIVWIFYCHSYEVPTKTIQFDLLDTEHDSLIIPHLYYQYDFGGSSQCIKKHSTLSFSVQPRDCPSPLDSLLNFGYVNFLSLLTGNQFPDSLKSNAEMFIHLLDTSYLNSPKRVLHVNEGRIQINDTIKGKYPSLSFLENLNINVDEEKIESTKEIIGLTINESIPFYGRFQKKLERKDSIQYYDFKPIHFSTITTSQIDNEYLFDETNLVVCFPENNFSSLTPFGLSREIKAPHPIFRSEDCSQTNFIFQFNPSSPTKLRIDTLSICFTSTTNVSKMNPEPSFVGVNFIRFDGSEKVESICKNGLCFHTTNPDMSNMMLIKMFVLTGILTALIGFAYKYLKLLFLEHLIVILRKHSWLKFMIIVFIIIFLCYVLYNII